VLDFAAISVVVTATMTNLPIKKIVFIEPKSPGAHVYSKWGFPRLGIIQLGTILEEAGYEVKVFIEEVKGIDWDDVFDADAVGISTITSTAPRAYEMARQIKKAGIPVFMGGPHVSFLAEEALEYCDFVLKGETEETIIPFIDTLLGKGKFEDVPGLCWHYGNRVMQNAPAVGCPDLDKFPIPNLDLITGSKKFKGDLSITPIMTSRGCPFGCNFCSVTMMFGRKYRFRSVENVIEELKMRRPEWVFFYDDNFAANKTHTKTLLRRMIEEGINTKWMAQVRIDVADDPELLDLMVRTNCKYVYIGLESINPKTLESLNKGQTPQDIERSINIIQDRGIRIHGMFIFGADSDEPKTIRQTVKFAKRNKLSSVQFMILTPLPGTPVFDQMEKEGRLLSKDWGYYDAHHVVFKPKKMNYLQLQKKTLSATLRFYSLPRIMDKINRFDIWSVIISSYGWRASRQMRKGTRDFVKQMKGKYKEYGDDIDLAKQNIGLKARKTSEDLKEFFHSINMDNIRRMKEKQIEKWRVSKGTPKQPV